MPSLWIKPRAPPSGNHERPFQYKLAVGGLSKVDENISILKCNTQHHSQYVDSKNMQWITYPIYELIIRVPRLSEIVIECIIHFDTCSKCLL